MTTDAPNVEELLAAAARLAGVEIPSADFPSLSAAFANQLGAIAALEAVDTDDLEPILSFDPRWR